MLASLTIPFVIAVGLAANEKPLALRTGDRIVLLGDTLIERDQAHGYLETALLTRFPSQKLRFRNLGWSADTVEGLSRVYFDSAEKGKERLHEQAKGQKPTVLLIGYGMAESLENPANPNPFAQRLGSLLDVIAKDVEAVVLFSPIRHEELAPPFPEAGEHNHVLSGFAESLRLLANDRRLSFVDLFHGLSSTQREYSLSNVTDNGIHLNRLGYWLFAQEFQSSLGMTGEPIAASLDARGSVLSQQGCVISNVQATASSLQFDQLDARLPTCITGVPERALLLPGVVRPALRVAGLPSGSYRLAIDDREITRATAAEWQAGVSLWNTPQHEQVERVRRLVHRKNKLFFERYRPQNITYLLLFRSHEQGQNAKEIDELDGIIATVEAEIDSAVQPVTHRYVLTREN